MASSPGGNGADKWCLEPVAGAREHVGTVGRGDHPLPWGLQCHLPRRLDFGQFVSLPTWPRLLPAGDCRSPGHGNAPRGLGASVCEPRVWRERGQCSLLLGAQSRACHAGTRARGR